MSGAADMWAGLAERLATVEQLQTIMLAEPSSVHEFPAVYGALRGFARSASGQSTAMTYRFALLLVVRWQERPEAEAELLDLVNPICAAIDADPMLGRRISAGMASVTAGDAGFIELGGTTFRVLDFSIEVLEKAPYRTGGI